MALTLRTYHDAKHTLICPEFNSEEDVYKFEWVSKQHPERESLQSFIATSFYKTYGADVHHFSDILVGCKDANGQWLAALGFSELTDKK
ncbi:MAG: hypothetical protein RL061_724 [Pseudomonadota bacterium]